MQRRPRIGLVSLGCAKALVDSERLLGRLRAAGYDTAPDYASADLVVVNTCGFIEAAEAESLDAIAEAMRENGRVVVTGCLGGRAERLRERFPGLVAVTGPAAFDEVVSAVTRVLPAPGPRPGAATPIVRLTPPHYAYLKIAEGCDHRCTFCIIPQLRGPLASRPPEDVLAEAEARVAAGARELVVIAQDTAAYGRDLPPRGRAWPGIAALAAALGELGVWVRLHYLYPYRALERLVPLMAEGRILPYLDMPLQHASPAVLRRMRRPARSADVLARLARWRALCPDLTVRSTFIVGFPGETEDDFRRLLDFLEAAELDRVGCFTYSAVAGAAANALPGAVPEEVKQERLARLMTLQQAISRRRLRRWVGRRIPVLVDAVEGDVALGRGPADAPEVDGCVHVRDAAGLRPGDLVEVEVERSGDHDLWGRPLGP
ncbi:30S ribosomal protein S12 methylthiotransferase RimO [Inmirania thermothiophila]|uniref:Ribosomal protein uS12 methylthiotransferase RimO n=1 Tax=Inmirania thermothiophila TaxID=1750597 RepID=A0A3N1Y6F9_9GAMM|nr:30S ribosomal protein S12 methylthiotransferase RimO [Inmirania thermothiophila]ROR34131.1 SSU ribosomal protein S12P methylthiotransferase [Inmirania thermothiophila]